MNYQTKKHFLNTLKLLSIVAFITVTLALFGCGGGGGSSGGGGNTNTAPTANDGTLTTDENVVAAGDLIADDPDGDTLTYSIVTNGIIGTATITDPDTGSYTYTPNPNVNGIDTFTFKVNDGKEDSNTATVTVTINPVNDPPTADAGLDQTVNEQTPVALDGTGSSDAEDGINLTYAWTQTGGTTVDLIDADTATPSFTAPAVSASTALTFELEVTDTGSLTDTDQVVVTVNNAGNLVGYVNDEQPDQVNLETEGTLDWKHWGLVDRDSVNQKAGVTEQISDWDFIGGLFYDANSGSTTAYSWSNGTPTADEPGTFRSVFFPTPNLEIGEGYTFTVSADASEKTLRVYLGVFGARAKFRAFLNDGSAPALEEFFENPNPLEKFKMVTVNFGAASNGQTLTIEVTYEADLGGDGSANVSIQAATLTTN
jgi:hypothetical protein